jgi:hypothetical protein
MAQTIFDAVGFDLMEGTFGNLNMSMLQLKRLKDLTLAADPNSFALPL